MGPAFLFCPGLLDFYIPGLVLKYGTEGIISKEKKLINCTSFKKSKETVKRL